MSSKPVRVLVVDNDAVMRRALRGSLAAQGYAIAEARSGVEALEEMGQRPADLVLLDIEMPGIGGMGLFSCSHFVNHGSPRTATAWSSSPSKR